MLIDTDTLLQAAAIIGINVGWWGRFGPREGRDFHHSLTGWFLENREKHVQRLLPFDERLVEIDFLGQEIGSPDAEPSMVVDYDALTSGPPPLPVDVDVEHMDDTDDDEPSIIIDYNALLPKTNGRAIALRSDQDDNLPSIIVADMDLEEVSQ